jgi:hypothetical protein
MKHFLILDATAELGLLTKVTGTRYNLPNGKIGFGFVIREGGNTESNEADQCAGTEERKHQCSLQFQRRNSFLVNLRLHDSYGNVYMEISSLGLYVVPSNRVSMRHSFLLQAVSE